METLKNLSKIVGHLSAGVPIPFVPILGSVLAEQRSKAFQRTCNNRFNRLELTVEEILKRAIQNENEIVDTYTRSYNAGVNSESIEMAQRLGCGAVEMIVNDSHVESVNTIKVLDHMSEFDLKALNLFKDNGRCNVGAIAKELFGSPHTPKQLSQLASSTQLLMAKGLIIPDTLHGTFLEVHKEDLNTWSGGLLNAGYSVSEFGQRLLKRTQP